MRPICPTCGQEIRDAPIIGPARVLEILRDGPKGMRNIYKGQDGNWYITYGGGQVSERVVRGLIGRGEVVRTYSSCDDSFTIGKTIDTEATLARRAKHGRKAGLVYTDGTADDPCPRPNAL